MNEPNDEIDHLHGRLLANELVTFALLAMLTDDRANRAATIHNVIGATDELFKNLPETTDIERRRKAWANAHWANMRAMFGQLATIDAGERRN